MHLCWAINLILTNNEHQGANYKPLDNEHQIREALDDMCNLINMKESVFEKAMLIFYEQNNISAFKNIFKNQFEFAVKAYF